MDFLSRLNEFLSFDFESAPFALQWTQHFSDEMVPFGIL